MKLKDKMKQVMLIDEILLEKFFTLTQISSFLNLLEEAIDETNDKIIEKFKEFQELVLDERDLIGEIEIKSGREEWKHL